MDELKDKLFVFHVHTKYSFDSFLKPKVIVDHLFKNDVYSVVITDHDTIKGAIEAKKYAKEKYGDKFLVVIGEEVNTDVGDIIGFPLKKEIKSREHKEVIKEIKNQGGMVVLPHPYNSHKLSKIDFKDIDFIETFNARYSQKDANDLAEKHGIKEIIGSDAHFKDDILNTYLVFDDDWKIKLQGRRKNKGINILKSRIIKRLKNYGYQIKGFG